MRETSFVFYFILFYTYIRPHNLQLHTRTVGRTIPGTRAFQIYQLGRFIG